MDYGFHPVLKGKLFFHHKTSKMEEQKRLSLGEQRVRVEFNPSKDGLVDQLKQKTAELINLVNSIEQKNSEHGRVKSLAMTSYEEAAMWAVKAATC